MSFETRLATRAAEIDRHLAGVLPAGPDLPVIAAMRYALEGGKKLRGFLVLEGAALFGVAADSALAAAAAIEAIHAYSLVHDDLPAMDDDDLRRGRATVHRAFDEATAILAGDALQTFAFACLADPAAHPDAEVRARLSATLAAAAHAMVVGQAQDLAAETAAAPLGLDGITDLQANKTGALIGWAATAGPILAGEDPAPLAAYAAALGLAFQIADDILDVTGSEAETGKRVGKDASRGKATFVGLLGLDGARARATSLVDAALTSLRPYGTRAEPLADAARFVVSRTH